MQQKRQDIKKIQKKQILFDNIKVERL